MLFELKIADRRQKLGFTHQQHIVHELSYGFDIRGIRGTGGRPVGDRVAGFNGYRLPQPPGKDKEGHVRPGHPRFGSLERSASPRPPHLELRGVAHRYVDDLRFRELLQNLAANGCRAGGQLGFDAVVEQIETSLLCEDTAAQNASLKSLPLSKIVAPRPAILTRLTVFGPSGRKTYAGTPSCAAA